MTQADGNFHIMMMIVSFFVNCIGKRKCKCNQKQNYEVCRECWIVKHIGFGKLSGFLTFATDSIYILGDPFEGEVCLCWEIPGDMPMSVPTLQREKRRKLVHGFKIGEIKSFFACFFFIWIFFICLKRIWKLVKKLTNQISIRRERFHQSRKPQGICISGRPYSTSFCTTHIFSFKTLWLTRMLVNTLFRYLLCSPNRIQQFHLNYGLQVNMSQCKLEVLTLVRPTTWRSFTVQKPWSRN